MSAIFYQQYLKTIDRNVKIAYKEFTRLLDYTIIDNEEVSLLVEELMYVEENKISSIIVYLRMMKQPKELINEYDNYKNKQSYLF